MVQRLKKISPRFPLWVSAFFLLAALVYAVDLNYNGLDDAFESKYFSTNIYVMPTNIVSHWPMEQSTTAILDLTTNHVDGVLSNFTTAPFLPGLYSNAIRFNTNSYVKFPITVLNTTTNEITFSTWFYGSNSTTKTTLARWYAKTGSTTNIWTFSLGTDNKPSVIFNSGTNAAVTVKGGTSSPAVRDALWHHLAFTYSQDGKLVSLYVDGVLQKSSAVGLSSFNLKNPQIFSWGVYPFTSTQTPFLMDETRLYGRALTPYEILLLPPTHSDLDGDGLDSAQEQAIGSSPLTADTDGDGIPDNYDPSPTQVLTLYSGNEQTSQTNQFLPAPLVVQVNQSGLPASGKKVTFKVTQGGGKLSGAPGGVLVTTTNINSDAQGHSSAYFKTPVTFGTTNKITATYIVGSQTNVITFQEYCIDARVSANRLQLWLKPDSGVVTNTAGKVIRWMDRSGNGNDATQTNITAYPTLSLNSLNGQSTLSFDGVGNYLNLPSGFNEYTNGFTAFVLTKPTSLANKAAFFDLGNASSSDNILFERTSTNASLSFMGYTGTTKTTNLAAPTGLTQNNFQILTAVHNGTNGASIYKNGSIQVTGPAAPLSLITRTSNRIGKDNWTANAYFKGNMAEMLIYNRELSESEIINVSDYLAVKYALYFPKAQLPVISPNGGSFVTSQSVTISSPTPGMELRYTTDGSEPNQTTSAIYTTPFTVNATTTIRARAFPPAGSTYSASLIAYANFEKKETSSPNSFTGLTLWLRADAGLHFDPTGNLTQWDDQSGNQYHASQTNLLTRPTWVTNQLNSKPIVRFNGTDQMLSMPSGFSNFSAGMTAFVITKAKSTGVRAGFFDLGGGSGSNNIIFGQTSTNSSFNLTVYNAASSKKLEAASTIIPTAFQSLAFVHDGNLDATLYLNGDAVKTGTVTNITSIVRTRNQIGKDAASADPYFKGDIAELIIYNRALSASEFSNLSDYINLKYGLITPTVHLPVITPNGGTFTGTQSVTLSCDTLGAVIRYTTNGTEPTSTSTIYSAPFSISAATTVKARGFLAGYNDSPIAYAAFDNSLTSLNVSTNLALWLRADAGLQRDNLGKLIGWLDQSGNGMNASPTNALTSPVWVTNSVNGRPAMNFNGTNQFFSLPPGFSDWTNGLTAFVVAKPTSTGTRAAFFDFGNGGRSNNVMFAHTGDKLSFASYVGRVSNQVDKVGVVSSSSWRIYTAQNNPGNLLSLYTNNVSTAFQGMPLGINNVLRNKNQIGKGLLSGDGFLKGDVSEILLYKRYLSPDERQNVTDQLALKYGIYIPVLKAPDFNPRGTSFGNYHNGPMSVTITCQNPDAKVRYTTDGSSPSSASPLYSGPIPIVPTASGVVLKARAFLSSFTSSSITADTYQFSPAATPVIQPQDSWLPGTFTSMYGSSVSVSITCGTPGAEIHYTTDGTTPTLGSPVYSGTLSVAVPKTVKAVAIAPGRSLSSVSAVSYKSKLYPPVLTPPSGGLAGMLLTITSAVSSAEIRYTTNGNNPNSSSTLYTGPFTPPLPSTVKAAAFLSGYVGSDVTIGSYEDNTPKVDTPTMQPPSGVYPTNIYVSITCNTPSAQIRYTTDDSTPTTSSALYTAPILLSSPKIFKVMAFKTGYISSPMMTSTYGWISTPLIEPSGGYFSGPQTVTLSCRTAGAVIRYTADGSAPTTVSPVYSSPITVTPPATIKAFATLPNFYGSSTASAVFNQIVDANGNGMDDDWETDNFGSPGAEPPDGDADGDGVTNKEEFDRESDPNSVTTSKTVYNASMPRERVYTLSFGASQDKPMWMTVSYIDNGLRNETTGEWIKGDNWGTDHPQVFPRDAELPPPFLITQNTLFGVYNDGGGLQGGTSPSGATISAEPIRGDLDVVGSALNEQEEESTGYPLSERVPGDPLTDQVQVSAVSPSAAGGQFSITSSSSQTKLWQDAAGTIPAPAQWNAALSKTFYVEYVPSASSPAESSLLTLKWSKDGSTMDLDKIKFIQVPSASVRSVSFGGSNYFELISDDASKSYSAPQYKDPTGSGTPSENYPAAFKRNSKPSIGAEFKLSAPVAGTPTIKIRATGTVTISETIATLNGQTLTLPLTQVTTALPNTVKFYNRNNGTAFALNWEIQINGGSWNKIGTTKHSVYVTLAMPQTPLRQITLFDVACRNADGKTSAAQIVTAIYNEFTDRIVQRINPDTGEPEGIPMTYWGPIDTPPDDCFFAYGLLKYGDGRCGAWADFFKNLLLVNGIFSNVVEVDPPEFDNAKLQNDIIAYLPADPNGYDILSMFYVYNWSFLGPFTQLDLPGVAGQGNSDPQADFVNHAIVIYNGKYYDPSYGTPPSSSQVVWENPAIEGYGAYVVNRTTGIASKWIGKLDPKDVVDCTFTIEP